MRHDFVTTLEIYFIFVFLLNFCNFMFKKYDVMLTKGKAQFHYNVLGCPILYLITKIALMLTTK